MRRPTLACVPAPSDEPAALVGAVRITHPSRVLYPEGRITKEEIARWYEAIAPWMLPHVAGRPLSLVRCPEGLDPRAARLGVHQSGRGGPGQSTCFFQKHAARWMPEAVARVRVPELRGPATYLAVHDARGLVSLAQMGALELHPWGSRADLPNCPDRMIFDLDPGPGVAWSEIAAAARELRARLDALGLPSWVKTTGGKGLHVVVPLARRHGWDEVKAFSRAMAEALAREAPERFVAVVAKHARAGRIYVDWLRNARGSTAVAAWSTRARPGAPVSVPLSWRALGRVEHPADLTVRTMLARVRRLRRDPWEGFFEARPCITAAMRREVGAA